MHVLDRPVWSSLTQGHAHLAQGGPLARRYAEDVNLFAAACDDSPEALEALRELVFPGSQVYLLQVGAPVVPADFEVLKTATGVQMLAPQISPPTDLGVVSLTAADAPDMLALARLTEPGPFLERTHVMGRFVGMRIEGRLAAMAGERFRFAGYTEISGVCTHPDFRGLGLARRLSAAVTAAIQTRGERAILHAWARNHAAVALYQSLGFTLRAEVDVVLVERRQP